LRETAEDTGLNLRETCHVRGDSETSTTATMEWEAVTSLMFKGMNLYVTCHCSLPCEASEVDPIFTKVLEAEESRLPMSINTPKPCWYFFRHVGTCDLGDRCSFDHVCDTPSYEWMINNAPPKPKVRVEPRPKQEYNTAQRSTSQREFGWRSSRELGSGNTVQQPRQSTSGSNSSAPWRRGMKN
jgi:hypothetical protein